MLQRFQETQQPVEDYLNRMRPALDRLEPERRETVLEQARARIELELELDSDVDLGRDRTLAVLERLGDPATLAQHLGGEALSAAPAAAPSAAVVLGAALGACRACGKEVSREAFSCPHCGAPFPARQYPREFGYEWKSPQRLFGLPLVHVAYGRDRNGKMRVARGIVAIGQFGIGAITIAQFGVGAIFGLGQFMVAPLAVGQFAFGLAAVGQFGIGILFGAGQFATGMIAHGLATFGNWLRPH